MEKAERKDVKFKSLRTGVRLQMFQPSLQDDDAFPVIVNLLVIGNNTGCFACGCPNGRLYTRFTCLICRSHVWDDKVASLSVRGTKALDNCYFEKCCHGQIA